MVFFLGMGSGKLEVKSTPSLLLLCFLPLHPSSLICFINGAVVFIRVQRYTTVSIVPNVIYSQMGTRVILKPTHPSAPLCYTGLPGLALAKQLT